jgi:hypothetical protein
MGALSVIGESPSERAALARVSSALAQTESDIGAVLAGQTRVESEMGKAADLKQDLAERIVGEAKSLIAAMKNSAASWALGQTGTRATRKSAELLGVSQLQTAIGEATLKEAASELQRLEAQRERLLEARKSIIKETVREALEPALLEDYADTLTHLREGLTRLTALGRFLEVETHDYRPDANRVAVTVPDFTGAGRDQAVVAEAKSIGQVEAILAQFAAALELDPRAPVPELEVDTLEDPDTPYHALSPAERVQIDRDFSPQAPRHRQTTDSLLFEEQLREAKSFVGLTN